MQEGMFTSASDTNFFDTEGFSQTDPLLGGARGGFQGSNPPLTPPEEGITDIAFDLAVKGILK